MDTRNTDWLNQNANRAYPIMDGASRLSTTGSQLDNGLIVDLAFPVLVSSGVLPGNLYIGSVVGFGVGLTVAIHNAADGGFLGSCTLYGVDKDYISAPLTSLTGLVGRITFGTRAAITAHVGRSEFYTADATRLVASVARPAASTVRGISVVDKNGVSHFLDGNITMRGGDNVTLSAYSSGNSGSITIGSLLTAQQENDDCGCGEGDAVTGVVSLPVTGGSESGLGGSESVTAKVPKGVILSINGVRPDANGDFKILATDCTDLIPVDGGLVLEDHCTEPCCGCDQLEAIQQALQTVENESSKLQSAAEQLRARLDNLVAVITNAAINPPGTAGGVGDWFRPPGPPLPGDEQ